MSDRHKIFSSFIEVIHELGCGALSDDPERYGSPLEVLRAAAAYVESNSREGHTLYNPKDLEIFVTDWGSE